MDYSFLSSIYFLDLSWSSFTSLRISSIASAILFNCSLSIIIPFCCAGLSFTPDTSKRVINTSYIILEPLSSEACCLRLGARLSFFFRMIFRIILKWQLLAGPITQRCLLTSSFCISTTPGSIGPANNDQSLCYAGPGDR